MFYMVVWLIIKARWVHCILFDSKNCQD